MDKSPNFFVKESMETKDEMMNMTISDEKKQQLHLVFGGELQDLSGYQFRNLDALDIVGVFPDYPSAFNAWKAKSQASVDNASQCYHIIPMHRLLDSHPSAS